MNENQFLSKVYEKQFSEAFPFGFTLSTNVKNIMLGDRVYSVAIRGNIEKDIVLYDYCSFASSYEEAYKNLADNLENIVAQYEEFIDNGEEEPFEFLDCQLSYRSFYETNEDFFLDQYDEEIAPMFKYYLNECNGDPKLTLKSLLENDIEYLFKYAH